MDILELKNIITEIKTSLEGFNSIFELEESANLKIDQLKSSNLRNRKKKRTKKNEQSLRDLWNSIKHINVYLMGAPEEEERKKEAE